MAMACMLSAFQAILSMESLFAFLGIDFHIKNVDIYRRKIRLLLWDTAGAERFHSITTSYYKGAVVGGCTVMISLVPGVLGGGGGGRMPGIHILTRFLLDFA